VSTESTPPSGASSEATAAKPEPTAPAQADVKAAKRAASAKPAASAKRAKPAPSAKAKPAAEPKRRPAAAATPKPGPAAASGTTSPDVSAPVADAGRQWAATLIQAQEEARDKLAESYMQAAASSHIPGLDKLAEAHATLLREVTDAYLAAARRLIDQR
jgi:hypothetical protein